MMTPKFIINNKSSVDDVILFESVLEVLKLGLISDYGKSYCFATAFHGKDYKYYVFMKKTNYGYAITIGDRD